jgi:phosphoserine phosphatase RsbU/P
MPSCPRPHLPTVPLPSIPFLRGRSLFAGRRAQRAVLWSVVGVTLAALLIYHASLAVVGQPPSTGTRVGADLAAALSFGLLAALLSRPLGDRLAHPMRALWHPLLAAGVGLALAGLLVGITGGPADVDPRTALPADLASAVQITGISIIEACVALVLLFSLKALILFRRTEASHRNWKILTALIVLAALVLVGRGPLEESQRFIPYMVLLVGAIVFMVANAFRLAWIVYLPFRQKVTAIGLSLGLIVLLVMLLSNRADAGWMGAFVFERGTRTGAELDVALSAIYSVPVSEFVTLILAFGILYCATTLLALLFHLPTAGALQQKSGEMEALQALARLSSEVFDRDRLVDTIAGAPVEAGVAQAAWVALIDTSRGSLRPHVAAAHGLTPTQIHAMTDTVRLAEDACASGAPLVLSHAPADHRVHARPGDGIGSLLVLPLRAHEETLGALFATRAVSQGFERDDVAALETFAAQAALALANARLFAERLEGERLARELSIAREVQQRLLPDTLPCSERLSCAALSLPAQEVAGDFYDVIELGEDRVGLLVADVAGKGTPAAFHMAEFKGVFQSVARLAAGPAEFLIRANEALAASLYGTAFISAIYAVIDERRGTVTLARAGHCPAILASEDGPVRLLRPRGIGLGLDRGPLFKSSLDEEQVLLQPGDALLLYTDGLVEARDHSGDEFGYERLAEAMQRHRNLDPDTIRDNLLLDLRRFARRDGPAGAGWEDDLTLVVTKWTDAARAEPPAPARSAPAEASVPV